MRIFIAGGTSGIGWELAQLYLNNGDVVGVCGRDLRKISNFSHPNLFAYEGDVCHADFINTTIDTFATGGLNLFVISAGAYTDSSLSKISYPDSIEMVQVNVVATTNMIFHVQNIMYKQSCKGQIAVIASVSGLLHYTQATIYSKTKHALIRIVEAYRSALEDFGIAFTIIAPGYVGTQKLKEYNDNDLSRKPFVTDTKQAALIIYEAICKKEELVVFPTKMKRLFKLLSFFPDGLLGFVMKKKALWMNKKNK